MTAPSNTDNMNVAFLREEECSVTAGSISCDAMTLLAKQEARNNATMLAYQTVYPVCERFQQLADRTEEHKLQKATVFARNACITKTNEFQQGPWDKQFSPIPGQNIGFDTWTRAKGSSQ